MTAPRSREWIPPRPVSGAVGYWQEFWCTPPEPGQGFRVPDGGHTWRTDPDGSYVREIHSCELVSP